MTRQEFIERTGFTPTEANFTLIHEEYMEAGPNVGKDQFCKEWLRNGGPQRAYDWARQVGASATSEMLTAKAERDDLSERMKSLVAKDTELVEVNHKLVDTNNELRKALLVAKLVFKNAMYLGLDNETNRMVMDTINNALNNQ